MNPILSSLLAYLDAASWEDVNRMAEATGVPFHTIAKIKRRETDNPRIKTVEALIAYVNGAHPEVA